MRILFIVLVLPVLAFAQEFEFMQEFDTIPVEIEGWDPHCPWAGGLRECNPAIVDLDSDGDPDFLIGEFTGTIKYFQNLGTTTVPSLSFVTYQLDSILEVESRANPCFKDLDNDGDLDLILGDVDSNIYFYRNIGTAQNPTFMLEDSSIVFVPPWCMCPELVDIDADGDYDLFGGNYGQVSFFENIGTPQVFNYNLVSGSFAGINVGDRASPKFINIDADGDYDLFIGNEVGKVWYYENIGTPDTCEFIYVTDFYDSIDVGWYASPEFADIDGDGDYDLFIGREQMSTNTDPGDIFFYENVGTPQVAQWDFITRNYISLDMGYTAKSAMTDIDADGDLDLFIQHTGDSLAFYENVGTPSSPSYRWITNSYQDISVNDANPEFGDLNDDLDPDLLMGEAAIPGPPGIYLFENQGSPQVPALSLLTTNFIPDVFTQASVSNAIALADIDDDGDKDLFTSDHDENFYFFENTGSPTQPQFSLISTNWQNVYPDSLNLQLRPTFYDIDGDDDLDLFCGTLYGWNLLWFYRNEGTSRIPQMVFETQTFLGEGLYQFTGVDVFDIDQDGDGDFLLSTYDGGMVFFRNITGQNEVGPRRPYVPYPKLDFSIGPNPANPVTWISFSLPAPQEATLAVYNILGAKVTTLASGLQMPGTHNIIWNASQYSSGIYIIRLEMGEWTEAERVGVVK